MTRFVLALAVFPMAATAVAQEAQPTELTQPGAVAAEATEPAPAPVKVAALELSCLASNGVEVKTIADAAPIESGFPAETKWGFLVRSFVSNLRADFSNLTWITLDRDGKAADDYHIFLYGKAEAGKKTTLYGSLGMGTVDVTLSPDLAFPVGFVPVASIACDVLWQQAP